MWLRVCGVVLVCVATAVLVAARFAVQRVPRWSFEQSVVLLTGGSSGIGLELAKCLAQRRVRYLVLAARTEAALQQAVLDVRAAAAAAGSATRVGYVVVDVSDAAAVRAAVAQASATLCDGAAFNLVICNAGFAHPARFVDCTAQHAQAMMQTNYFGAVHVLSAVLPSMLARGGGGGGRVVITSSLAARAPIAGYALYASTKAALRALAHSVDMECSCLGVRVQVLSPPDVATPGLAREDVVKSAECVAISRMGGARPYTAQAMAAAAMHGIEHYRFDTTLGSDGALVRLATATLEPATSVCELLLQLLLCGPLRLGLAVVAKLHYNIVRRIRTREKRA